MRDTEKSSARRWVGILAMAVAGMAMGAAIALLTKSQADAPEDQPAWMIGFVVVSIFAGFVVSLIVHELGHALAGLAVGRRLNVFHVGPLWLVRQSGRWQLRRHRLTSSIGGLVLMSDARTDRTPASVRRRDLAFVAGGCFANFVLSAGAMSLGYSDTIVGLAGRFIEIVGEVSLFLGLINLVPLKLAGGIKTDGRAIFEILTGRHSVREQAAMNLVKTALAGIRPRDWDVAELARLEGPSDGTLDDALSSFLRYGRALDENDIARAGVMLDRTLQLVDRFPALSRPSVYAEAAYFIARYRADAPAAQALRDRATGTLVERFSQLQADAAIALTRGEFARAIEHCEAALRAWSRPLLVSTPEAKDHIEQMLADARAGRSIPHAPASDRTILPNSAGAGADSLAAHRRLAVD